MIVAQGQVILWMLYDKHRIKCVRLFFLIDSIDCLEDLTSNKFIIPIYCIDNFSWTTVFVCAIIEAKK